jgi:hypothetical protein
LAPSGSAPAIPDLPNMFDVNDAAEPGRAATV